MAHININQEQLGGVTQKTWDVTLFEKPHKGLAAKLGSENYWNWVPHCHGSSPCSFIVPICLKKHKVRALPSGDLT